MKNCPLCDMETDEINAETFRIGVFKVMCQRCGDFSILDYESEDLKREEIAYILSGYTRHQKEFKRPEVDFGKVELESILSQYSGLRVETKSMLLLNVLGQMTPNPGHTVILDTNRDYTLGFCKDYNEFIYHLDYLEDSKYITRSANARGEGPVCVTHSGWRKIEDNETNISSNSIFIARSFDSEMALIRDQAIIPAIQEAGFDPVDMGILEHNDRIDERLIVEIKKVKLVVADFTNQKHGVYFEAGYGLGLGIPVIWCCNKQELDEKKNHFDTRQFNHIDWEDGKLPEFKERLKNRIIATIGFGKKYKQ